MLRRPELARLGKTDACEEGVGSCSERGAELGGASFGGARQVAFQPLVHEDGNVA